jgi:predicted nuclease of restriction endonuclease-like (RecB) superfamily
MSDINVLLLVEDDDNDIIITKRLISRSSIRVNTVRIAKTLAEGMAIIRDDNVNKNQINDALLRRSIIYSIERKKVKDKLASMIPRIQELATIGKK